jgi:membrane protein DedA with SNARE-associated domain
MVNELIQTHATAAWAVPVVFLLAALDGILPPLPSESIVIALAAVSAVTQSPHPLWLGVAAAAGAFAGDNLAYLLGRRFGLRRMQQTRSARLRGAMRRAGHALDGRGAVIILVARYVPVGRVAVNLTAGASGYPHRRFLGLTALAALSWSAYSVAVGLLSGHWAEDNAVLGMVAGVAFAVVLGVLVDHLVRRVTAAPPRPASGGAPRQ